MVSGVRVYDLVSICSNASLRVMKQPFGPHTTSCPYQVRNLHHDPVVNSIRIPAQPTSDDWILQGFSPVLGVAAQQVSRHQTTAMSTSNTTRSHVPAR